MLLADIKRAGSIPTDVILFNIDSKAENTNGMKDKILDVFEKVFSDGGFSLHDECKCRSCANKYGD